MMKLKILVCVLMLVSISIFSGCTEPDLEFVTLCGKIVDVQMASGGSIALLTFDTGDIIRIVMGKDVLKQNVDVCIDFVGQEYGGLNSRFLYAIENIEYR